LCTNALCTKTTGTRLRIGYPGVGGEMAFTDAGFVLGLGGELGFEYAFEIPLSIGVR